MSRMKPIEDFPNYTISTDGVVYNVAKKMVMKQFKDKDGYGVLNLSTNNIKKQKKVHRLVAAAFIPTDDQTMTVNHKDGDKDNNNVSNLEGVSNEDNIRHAYETGLIKKNPKGENSCSAKLTFKEAEQIREGFNKGIYNRKQIAEMFDITTASVGNIINNKTYKACDHTS